MTVSRWDESSKPTENALREILEQKGYVVSVYTYPPGTYFPPHDHQVDKIDAVLSGRFLIEMNGEKIELRPGDMVEVPAGEVHSAKVLGNETVISLDAIKKGI